MKKMHGEEILNKIYPIAGDVSELNLAISESDRRLLADTVEVVYHAAATIRFDEALKKAVLLNTRGTKLVLDLAKEMKKLQVECPFKTSRRKFFLFLTRFFFRNHFHSCSCTFRRLTAIWTRRCCSKRRTRHQSIRTRSFKAWNCWTNLSSKW